MILLKLLKQRHSNLLSDRGEDTRLLELASKDLLSGNGTRDTDSAGHGRVLALLFRTVRVAVQTESRGADFFAAVSPLDTEFVLEHDEITLAVLELHLLLESRAEGVEGVASRDDLVGREKTEPLETADDTLLQAGVGVSLQRRGKGVDGSNKVLLLSGLSTGDLGEDLVPGNSGVEEVFRSVVEETQVDKDLDELRETLVSEGASDAVLGLRDVVELAVRRRVAVGVADESVARVDEVRLGRAHEIRASNVDDLALRVELGGVTEGQKDTTGRPRELVAKRVVGILGGRKTTTVRKERGDLTLLLVDLLDGLDGVEVIDSGIETDLVHDNNTGVLDLLLKSFDSRRDVTGGDDVLLVTDSGLDDLDVVDVRDQRDDNIVLRDSLVELGLVLDIDGLGSSDSTGKGFGLLESTAGNSDLDAGLGGKDIDGRLGNEAGTKKQYFLSHIWWWYNSNVGV